MICDRRFLFLILLVESPLNLAKVISNILIPRRCGITSTTERLSAFHNNPIRWLQLRGGEVATVQSVISSS